MYLGDESVRRWMKRIDSWERKISFCFYIRQQSFSSFSSSCNHTLQPDHHHLHAPPFWGMASHTRITFPSRRLDLALYRYSAFQSSLLLHRIHAFRGKRRISPILSPRLGTLTCFTLPYSTQPPLLVPL